MPNLPPLSWPQAFVLVFGGMPLIVFATAAVVTYPAVTLSMLTVLAIAVCFGRNQSRRAALAKRAFRRVRACLRPGCPAIARLADRANPQTPKAIR